MGWTTDSLTVRQFPTPAFAEEWARPFVDGGCASFNLGQIELTTRVDTTVVAEVDDRVFALRLRYSGTNDSARTVIVGRESNVVVTIDTDVDLSDTDAASLATLVNDKMTAARAAVTEKIGYR